MSTTDFPNWVPIEYSSEVVQRAIQESAVERYGRGIKMTSDTKKVPRSAGHSVGTGATYTADSSTADTVLLDSVKFTGQDLMDADQLADAESIIDVIGTKARDWATSYAVAFDNSCLGVTAANNASSTQTRPFDSVYYKVRNNDSAAGYTADANYVNYNGSASGAYTSLSNALGLVEGGAYWREANAVVVAHPNFRQVLRNATDTQGRPIFVQGQSGDSGQPDTLFGIEIVWSRGAKTSNVRSEEPEGNPLLVIVADREKLIRGDREPVQFRMDEGRAHDSTDETALKFKSRKAFVVGHTKAFAVVEKTA
jgi:HK97 family phage major capsid protein